MTIEFSNRSICCTINVHEVGMLIIANKHYVVAKVVDTTSILYACPCLKVPEIKDGLSLFEVVEGYNILILE